MKLTQEDLRFVVTRLPRDIRTLMQTTPSLLLLAGGFIRETIAGGKPSDIDLFSDTVPRLEAAANALSATRVGTRQHKTKNAITCLSGTRLPVQFIGRWLFTTPEQCLLSFDFTVCQAVVWFNGETWDSAVSDAFYPDLAARRLVYTFPRREEEAGGSLLRVRKFLARGYNIQAPSLAGVVARLALAVDYGKAQGEERVAQVISGLLREVDPNTAVDGFDMVDEHEVIAEPA